VATTVTDEVIGVAPAADGIDLQAGKSDLYDGLDVSIEDIWMKSAGSDAAVTIIEG
jgi:hypothetical protein